jgi:hypothetical protein
MTCFSGVADPRGLLVCHIATSFIANIFLMERVGMATIAEHKPTGRIMRHVLMCVYS